MIFFIMKSLQVGDLRAEIKILHFLQMGQFVFATACAVYASKLLSHAQCALANGYRMRSVRQQIANTILRDFTQFYAICFRMRSVRQQFATVCAVSARIRYCMRSVRQQFATICAVYANKAEHMLILSIYLNQVLTNEKSEKSEKAILTPSSGPLRNLKQLLFQC